MKIIYYLMIFFVLGFHHTVSGQYKDESVKFVQKRFKNMEPIVYTDIFFKGMLNEFRRIFSLDTLRNSQNKIMLVLTGTEKKYVQNEIEKLHQKFGDKEMLKKSLFIPSEKLDSILKLNFPRKSASEAIAGVKAWFDFQEKYGVGYYCFSKPIFIRNNSICIFYDDFSCGEMCGKGEIAVYKKRGKKWIKWFTLNEFIS